MQKNYLVDISNETNKSLKEKSGLTPFFTKSGHRFFEDLFDHKFFRHFFFHKPPKSSLALLRELLNSPDYFDNELYHIVFKAFVYAEARFIQNYIPQNSHEERLTGHLISEYSAALAIVRKTFEEKAKELYDEDLTLNFYYADLSSNNNEKKTGADFGIIFHINLPDYPNEVRAAIFQAKKFKSNFLVDIQQCETLKNYAKEGANYCLYDMETQETSSPLVIKANRISLPSFKEQSTKSFNRNEVFENWDGGIPLSLFLVFNMLVNENSNDYRKFKSLWEAKSFMTDKQNFENNPSKILVVSIGGIENTGQDLQDLSRLFNFSDFRE